MVTFLYTASSYGDNWRVNRIDMLTKNGLLLQLSWPQLRQKMPLAYCLSTHFRQCNMMLLG